MPSTTEMLDQLSELAAAATGARRRRPSPPGKVVNATVHALAELALAQNGANR